MRSILLSLVVLTASGCSCSTKEPKVGFPPIGKTMTILPIAVNPTGPVKSDLGTLPALRLTVMFGGHPTRGDVTFNFYKGDHQLAKSVKWADLEEAYKKTGCSNDQILDGLQDKPAGTVLVCDGSLNGLANGEWNFVEGIEADEPEEPHTATSWSTYKYNEEILGVSILTLERQ